MMMMMMLAVSTRFRPHLFESVCSVCHCC